MKQKFILLSLLFCVIGYIWMGSVNVYASNNPDILSFSNNNTVFSYKDLVISERQKIDHIVEFGDDVTLAGSAREIIVVGGNLHLKKSAQVGELVLVIGGKITQEPGAKVTDEIFHLSFDHQMANNLLITSSFLFGWWFFRFSFSLLLFILPIATVLIARQRIDPFIVRIRQELKQTILIGITTSLLLIAIAFLLIISIIGIPILIILALILVVFSIISLTAVSIMIGEQISLLRGREKWLIAAVGSAILASVINFPLLGGILLLGLHWLSLGLMTTWLWEKKDIWSKPKIKGMK
ncbi:hypothetical protein MK805_14190 [Shimazuella sp. AN120528]|uniref:hypothetical protein n=1 Tax=Shimazuella soli TaxID=1892854 RepID=UPI001F1010F2|nr:hypothetical protein [Shimazuella soli]MCH5586088.1 hypothetical protein [Shimazuella soli]